MDDEDVIPLSALQHYLYCPRQCALIHLEQQWAENRQTAQGQALHKRVDQSRAVNRRGVRTVTGMPLAHAELGLTGIADVVEFHMTPQGERAFPVEFKRGYPKAHRADEVQLCAQAMCLESMLGYAVPAGALFYGETRRRSDIGFDDALRQLTRDTTTNVRAMLRARQTPRARYEARKCSACSLIDLCQPQLADRRNSVATWLARELQQGQA
ncbi:MAG: CRISPR-associated protein Cas4 [Ramlibacter sp.]|nr:CRISPR-associated protein Cas4 [Ramlibacter sp.]